MEVLAQIAASFGVHAAITGLFGIVLGILALRIGMPDFPATDYLTAAAVGGASGLAATGADQVVKQLKQ